MAKAHERVRFKVPADGNLKLPDSIARNVGMTYDMFLMPIDKPANPKKQHEIINKYAERKEPVWKKADHPDLCSTRDIIRTVNRMRKS